MFLGLKPKKTVKKPYLPQARGPLIVGASFETQPLDHAARRGGARSKAWTLPGTGAQKFCCLHVQIEKGSLGTSLKTAWVPPLTPAPSRWVHAPSSAWSGTRFTDGALPDAIDVLDRRRTRARPARRHRSAPELRKRLARRRDPPGGEARQVGHHETFSKTS